MLTLEKSKQLLLMQLRSKSHLDITKNGNDPDLCLKEFRVASRKLVQVYALIAALPVSNHIFEWFRSNVDKVRIELIDDKVHIYKIEGQYLERVEFGEGDLCNLIYKTLENPN
jgi:hypothetical protein